VLAVAAPPTLGQTTKAEYVDEANAVCKSSARKGRRTLAKIRPTGDPATDTVRRFSVFGKLLGTVARKLDAIELPTTDESQIEKWISSIRRHKRLIERSVRAYRHGQVSKAQSIAARSQRVGASTRAKARVLGIKNCAADG
jgi:hypothetical protein